MRRPSVIAAGEAPFAALHEFLIQDEFLQQQQQQPLLAIATPPAAAASKKGCGNDHASTCPWWPYSSSKDFRTSAVMILMILFCLLFCALAAFRYIFRRCRSSSSGSSRMTSGDVHVPAAEAVEPKGAGGGTMLIMFSEAEGMGLTGTGAEECSVCLTEFIQGDGIRVLDRCKHGFHDHCIREWLISHSSCPTCRSGVLLSNADRSDPSLSSDHS